MLLIEDDPTMLSLLGTLLEMEGYQPVKLDQFEAIPDVVRQEMPDIVLMDVHLNEINGLDILDELRQDEALKEIKMIMSSGMDFSRESIEHGANEFIQKPYMPDDLIDLIKKLSVQEGES